MICPKCNFNNADGSTRCINCGAMFSVSSFQGPSEQIDIGEEEVTGEKTDVLTSGMAPQNKPKNAANNTRPRQEMSDVKAFDSAKKPDGKSKTYFTASIAAMAVMVLIIIFSSVHYKNKINDLKRQKKDISASAEETQKDYEDKIASLTDANASLSGSNSEYGSQISDMEGDVSDLQTELEVAKGEAENYIKQIEETNKKYGGLIEYASSYAAQGNAAFFCSDSILHLKAGDKKTMVYVYFRPDGELSSVSSDKGVAACKFSTKEDEILDDGRLYPLYITPKSAGSAVITIKNSLMPVELKIYVYVEGEAEGTDEKAADADKTEEAAE